MVAICYFIFGALNGVSYPGTEVRLSLIALNIVFIIAVLGLLKKEALDYKLVGFANKIYTCFWLSMYWQFS